MYAKKVEELLIYKLAFELSVEIDKLAKAMPDYWQNDDIKQVI